MLTVDSYKANRAKQEFLRMTAAHIKLLEKLEEYRDVNGHYPDTIEALSFTNSLQESEMASDIVKIHYQRTQSGFKLRYLGAYGYNIVFSS